MIGIRLTLQFDPREHVWLICDDSNAYRSAKTLDEVPDAIRSTLKVISEELMTMVNKGK